MITNQNGNFDINIPLGGFSASDSDLTDSFFSIFGLKEGSLTLSYVRDQVHNSGDAMNATIAMPAESVSYERYISLFRSVCHSMAYVPSLGGVEKVKVLDCTIAVGIPSIVLLCDRIIEYLFACTTFEEAERVRQYLTNASNISTRLYLNTRSVSYSLTGDDSFKRATKSSNEDVASLLLTLGVRAGCYLPIGVSLQRRSDGDEIAAEVTLSIYCVPIVSEFEVLYDDVVTSVQISSNYPTFYQGSITVAIPEKLQLMSERIMKDDGFIVDNNIRYANQKRRLAGQQVGSRSVRQNNTTGKTTYASNRRSGVFRTRKF